METVVHINQTKTNCNVISLICIHILQICMRIKDLRSNVTERLWSILEDVEFTSCLPLLFMIK